MNMITISVKGQTGEIAAGLRRLEEEGILALSGGGLSVSAVKQTSGSGFYIDKTANEAVVGYSRPVEFYRAISYLLQGAGNVRQKPSFTDCGYMHDCSRNAVMSVPAVKTLLCRMALMGLNTLQLYTEDTFEIPGWPYFGYQRGRYTAAELKEIDGCANDLGIELIPCVQTLAHLESALRWPEFQDIIDCNDIMLAGDEKTYRFIDDMVRQLAACFTSRRINIGMDEAHMLGLGKYLDKHGYQNRSEIMCSHLSRVAEICAKYGFKPMMWSDMFFRLAAAGEYYDAGGGDISGGFTLPPEVTLAYWDYYHKDKAHYTAMLERHKKFPNPVAFAGGAWKWGGLLPDLEMTMDISRPALEACRDTGIKDVFVTGWGDNGAECPAFTILPALQLYAEYSYQGEISDEEMRLRFNACTGGIWDDFFLLDKPNNPTGKDGYIVLPYAGANPTKYLLYQDPMLGLFDKHADAATYPAHFARCAGELREAAGRNGQWGYIFTHAAAICKTLERKSALGIDITKAYREGQKEELTRLADTKLPETLKLVKELTLSFEKSWLTENKPQGLEVLHIRLGGVCMRLEAAARRINAYLGGETGRLEELETERLRFDGACEEDKDINIHSNHWGLIASASKVTGYA